MERTDALRGLAESFLADHPDPEIDRRLFFDAWADKARYQVPLRRDLWREINRVIRSKAARKRWAARKGMV